MIYIYLVIAFQYNHEDGIFYVRRHGDITDEDIIGYIRSLDEHSKELDRLFILDDSRNSTYVFQPGDVEKFTNEVAGRISRVKEVRHAVIVDKPFDTAMSMLFEFLSKSIGKGYSYKTFTTEQAAIYWLKDE